MALIKINAHSAIDPATVVAVDKFDPVPPGCGVDDDLLAGYVVVSTSRGDYRVLVTDGQTVDEAFDAVVSAINRAAGQVWFVPKGCDFVETDHSRAGYASMGRLDCIP